MNVNIIIWLIVILFLIINIIREVFVYKEIKSNFICTHCGELNTQIYKDCNCIKCHRRFKIKGDNWDHLITHRVNWISPYNGKDIVLNDYKKLPIIEISISLVAIVIITAAIIITII